jgi:hypothetical protein
MVELKIDLFSIFVLEKGKSCTVSQCFLSKRKKKDESGQNLDKIMLSFVNSPLTQVIAN